MKQDDFEVLESFVLHPGMDLVRKQWEEQCRFHQERALSRGDTEWEKGVAEGIRIAMELPMELYEKGKQ